MPFSRSIASRIEGEALLRILRAVEGFEDALKGGGSPPLEDLLRGSTGAERAELLRQAIGLELDYRRSHGESPEPEGYLRRFPEDAEIIRDLFGEPTVSRITESGTEPSPDPPHVPVPETIGKFAVLGRLGQGGQGSAYLARDPDLGRLVVLKRYHTAPAGPDAHGAVRDGKALSRLRTRYAAQCFGIERAGDDLILVLEYVPGRNLAEILKSGLPPRGAASRWIEQVAEGLEEVHACGLVHRDVKPANIVLGDDGVPRLVDFGLAAHLGSMALEGISGSPPYMSPEQARGQWERIDGRTDVYGLGAVLYSLLTGAPPHPGRTPQESLEHARIGEITRPRALNRSIPRDLERVVTKALAADPPRRFGSAAELRRALRLCRLKTAVLAGALLLVLMAAYPITRGRTRGDDGTRAAPALPPQQLIRVDRGGRAVLLQDAVPLVTGDRLWVECDLPAGWNASAFWLDSEGKITELSPVSVSRQGDFDRLSYPPQGRNNSVTLEGPPGTELIFICARPGPKASLREVEALIPPSAARTALRGRSVIFLGRGRAEFMDQSPTLDRASRSAPDEVRGLGHLQASEARDAEDSFRGIASSLEQRFAFSAGAAFPHR